MQLSSEEENIEVTNGEILAQIGMVDTQTARRVLRKHRGDMEKAVDALLAGDRGEANAWDTQHRTTPEPKYSDGRSTAIAPHPSSSVIDLTGDGEEELSRAIQMSMQDGSDVQFGPSDRAPHPDWQMVPITSPTHDRILDDAIQASLQDFNKEEEEENSLLPSVREGGRPIALRHGALGYVYATLALHALFHVPQVRAALSTIRLPRIKEDSPADSPERVVRGLIELFTNLDLAQISFMADIEVAASLGIPPFDPTKPLSTATAHAVRIINLLIEEQMKEQAADPDEPERLFSFTHGRVTLGQSGRTARVDRFAECGAVVGVEYGADNPHNDLVSCMEYILVNTANNLTSYDVILTPSDVIGFQLARSPSTSKSSPDPLVYPKTLYLDRFLFHNLEVTNEKRKIKYRMQQEIQELKRHRETLTRFNGRDTLSDLRSTLYYYEHVAEKGDDESRLLTLERTANQLKDILIVITAKVEDIDHRLEKLQADVSVVLECPELQEFRYDLRAVLIHTGLPGRKQMYSYVQDIEGAWWKTVDKEVVEVPEETVLTDPTGLHLGAGPYLLLYSRHLTDEQLHEPLVWPTGFSDVVEQEAVEENNKRFLAAMHPELGIFQNSSSEGHSPMAGQEVIVEGDKVVAGIGGEGTWSMSLD